MNELVLLFVEQRAFTDFIADPVRPTDGKPQKVRPADLPKVLKR